MSSEWTTSSLLDHYEVRSGLSKPAKDFGSGYPFLTFKDVFYNYFTPESLGDFVQSTQKEREGCSILRGDVFLTRTSETMHELGMSCVALRDYKDSTFNGFCKRLRPKPASDLLPEYVGYYLRSPRFRRAMLALSSLSTRASLNNEMIGRLEISFPSLTVQTQISGILKSLDDRIALLRETNATLEAIAQALFKSWLVDFDPVRARMEGRAPGGMDEATAALFPGGFEESELGLKPAGWSVTRLSDVLRIKNERVEQLKVPEYASTNEGLIPRAEIYKKQLAVSASKNKIVRRGEIVFGLSRKVLNFGQMTDEIGSVSSAYKVYQVDSQKVIPEFLGRLIRTRAEYFFNAVSASSREGQSVSSEALGMLSFVQPPRNIQNILLLAMQPLLLRSKACLEQLNVLTEVRDTLLPRLISGQLRLPAAQAAAEEALA